MAALSLETSITVVGLGCELAGFLIMARDIFRVRALDTMIKNTTLNKDSIFADTSADCYEFNDTLAKFTRMTVNLFISLKLRAGLNLMEMRRSEERRVGKECRYR